MTEHKKEVATELTSLKERINDLIDQKIKELNESPEEIESDKFKVLKAVYNNGGEIDQKKLYEIVDEKTSYEDHRAVGGLFSWQDQGARLKKVDKMSGTEYILTKAGKKTVESQM